MATPVETPTVNSHNEWDPLEEVIVGTVEGSAIPPWDVSLRATMPEKHWDFFQRSGDRRFPPQLVENARRELEDFVHILEAEGIKVRRPDAADYSRPFATPDWESENGVYSAMPRDLLLVVGEEIIEAPMAWRSRYFEVNAYRSLLKEYSRAGARWTSAPRPTLVDELYDHNFEDPPEDGPARYVINDFEPTFDAADFVRCGRDVIGQLSNVTNAFGVEWLQRHLGSDYRVHVIDVHDSHPMHIDATLMPLAPGKVLINPERLPRIPELFKSWDVLEAPLPCFPDDLPLYMSSKWLSMNVLSFDEERVVVERGEHRMIRALEDWGFKPIPCAFRNFNAFGGAFHCATLDVRRRGDLESYF